MNKRPCDRKAIPTRRRLWSRRVASPLVGRDEELRRLASALALAAEGQGGIIFLTGQPGIGKTRLARETLALAKQRGFTVLQGRAYSLGIGLAYAPLLDALGPLLRSLKPDRLEALVEGLPDLGRLFGGLKLPSPKPLGDPALEKTRLFEAVSRLLERLTREAPLSLFIDDLHWADPASFELLNYLARGLSEHRALLLSTYSSDALNSSRGLRALVGPLLRDGAAEEMVLPSLGLKAIGRMARGILGGEAPSELLSLLDARAGGTPLFVEALIGALLESGNLVPGDGGWALNTEGVNTLPPSVRRLILDRLERLEPDDRCVLDLISIIGDATSHTILRAATGLEEEALIAALRHLRDMGLVAEGMDGLELTYSIAHPLIREVAYAELPEAARRQAHMAAVEALESFPEGRPDDVNRLARHYRGAGAEADPERALAVLIAAGERARSLYANEEAARHYGAALAIVRGRRGKLSTLPDVLSWLLERLGEAWERVGEVGAAVGVWNEALVLLAEGEGSPDAIAASRLRRQLALAELDRGRFDIASAHITAGLVGLDGHEPCQELADLHFARFCVRNRVGDVAGVADTAAEFLSLAGRLASPRAEAEANLVASVSCLWQRDVTTARERALRALVIAEEMQEVAVCCRAHITLIVTGMRLGDHRFMRHHAETGLAEARRLGTPHMEALLHLYLAFANFMSGAWDESLRCNAEAVALARRVGHPSDLAHSLAEQTMILALLGDFPEAEACLSEARIVLEGALTVDKPTFSLIDIAEMALAIERGQVERALAITQGLARTSELAAAPVGTMAASMPMGLMLLAEAQVTAGDAKTALETARDIIELGPADTPYLTALASRAEGLAHQALGQREAAAVCLERAQAAFAALEMSFEAARALLEQAAAANAERLEVAAVAARQSLFTFERLGARRYIGRARRLLREHGIAAPTPHRIRPKECPLSARELEIARLVAEGLTTPEIAKRLILSPLTVGAHLHHIYARLGIGSRAALARYMIEARLLSSPENT